MALTRQQKEAQVKDLTKKFKSAQSVMFTNYIGLTVSEVSELRAQLKEQDSEMQVAKKTLIKIAAKEAGMPEIDANIITGPVSCIFSTIDPLSGAQIAFKFGKAHNQVKILGGIFDGKILTKNESMELAMMPGRTELLAIFATMINSPLVTFAGMCNSPLTGFARAVSEIAEKGGLSEEETTEKDGKEEKELKEENEPDNSEETQASASEPQLEPQPEPEPEPQPNPQPNPQPES
ncbi:50S ribosomal protein L10 [Patescibacteria group bacterium]|nr:50S ribosomal protein L10 [Patescibacteria group bacterium]